MSSLQLLLLDLFTYLRSRGMKLTIEQFEVLTQAVGQGDQIQDWQHFRRICRLILLKTHEKQDTEEFEYALDYYKDIWQELIEGAREQLRTGAEEEEKRGEREKIKPLPLENELPRIPPRIFPNRTNSKAPDRTTEAQPDTPTAIKVDGKQTNINSAQFTLRDLPLTLQRIKQTWDILRRPVQAGAEQELDLESTLQQIEKEGFLSEIKTRPVLRRQADLLVLIDDNNPMLPFRPAIQPLIQAVQENRIGPAQIYRFTTYPVEYLYEWQSPTQAVAITTVLSRLHRQRTVVLIVSDAGAASRVYSNLRIQKTRKFLSQLLPSVREVFWLNPLPIERWDGTSAAEIAQHDLPERMLPLAHLGSLQRVEVWQWT